MQMFKSTVLLSRSSGSTNKCTPLILSILLLHLLLAVSAQAQEMVSHNSALTLLNEVGKLARRVEPAEVVTWRRLLHAGHLVPRRAAQLHLWLGEIALAHNKEPLQAEWHFTVAQRLAPHSDPLSGCARYDQAVVLFYEGRYALAAPAFQALLHTQHSLHGYSLRNCALWYRHAAACASYHASHEKLGITEPNRLEPLCGVEALAACLQAHGRPFDRKVLLANCRVTGLGNSMEDLRQGALRLGMSAWPVKAEDEALVALPKPLIAYVEQDHFVAVTHADHDGVRYLCSDCGAWPGGKRELTWKQWQAMDCNLYLVVTTPGSSEEKTMAALRREDEPLHLSDGAVYRRLTACAPHAKRNQSTLLRTLANSAELYLTPPNVICGQQPSSLQDTPEMSDAMDSGGDAPCAICKLFGSSDGDPVNLATGEEEYQPEPDLIVYNPIGPSVVWKRQFGSMRGLYQVPAGLADYTQSAFGNGWNSAYDMQVIVSADNTQVLLFLPNGASYPFNLPSPPTAANPNVACPGALGGIPMLCTWSYNTNGAFSFTFTRNDRSQWIFSSANGYALTRIVDRSGNYITFSYITPGSIAGYELSAISDSNGQPLLTIQHNANYNITSVSDRYGRSVYYQVKRLPNLGVPTGYAQYADELTQVSQVVPTGTHLPPARYIFGYMVNTNGIPNGEEVQALHTITVPSPTGRGASTTTINYSNIYVGNTVDANRNTTVYKAVDGSHTQVTVKDSHGNIVYTYTVGFDGQMREVTRTDGTNQTIVSFSRYRPDNAYQPYSVLDGNRHTTIYTYDAYGHPKTVLSPRHVLTIYSWVYTAFPLGELQQVQEGSKSPTSFAYYEPSGLVHTVTTPTPGTAGAATGVTTTFTFDALGNVLTIQHPGNDSTSAITTTFIYTHDSGYSQPEAIGQPLALRDNLGHATHFRYDAQGNCISTTDALGNRTDFEYNIANQLAKTFAPAIGDVSASLTVLRSPLTYNSQAKTYDGTLTLTNTSTQTLQGSLLVALTNLPMGVTLANASGIYVKNPALLSPHVNLAPQQTVTLTVSFHAPSSSVVSYGAQTYLTDNQGNPLAQRPVTECQYLYPGGPQIAVIAYDEGGNAVRQVLYGYGREGELLSVSGSTEPVRYTYDAAYRRQTLADGNHNATSYAYNTAGWPSSITYPMGDMVQFPKYDPLGNVLKRIDGRGIETDFQYQDPESLLTSVQYVNSPNYPNVSQYNVTIDYDGYGRTQDINDFAGQTSRAYDDLDTLTDITTTYNRANGALPPVTLTYGFNPDGSRHSMTIDTNATNYAFTYSYDAAGRPKALTNPFKETTMWNYLPNNWLASQQDANGVVTQYAYNGRGFLNDLTHYATGTTLLSDFGTMTYDSVGNRLTMVSTLPAAPAGYSGITAYQYDLKDQLTQEQSTLANGYTHGFNYDPAGNPLQFKSATNSFNKDNQFTNSGFVYDGEGNPTTYAGTTLTFDPENHMTAYGNLLTAGYTGSGLRAWKQTKNGTAFFLYDGITPVCELDATGAVSAVNTFSANGLLSRHTSAGTTFYNFDPQGSVAQRLDTTGKLLSTSVFDAFGAGTTAPTSIDPFGYGGKWGYYTDTSINLTLLGQRYYDPNLARFINRDPVKNLGGINIFAYVHNNPTGHIDPNGLVSSGLGEAVFKSVNGGFFNSLVGIGESSNTQQTNAVIAQVLVTGGVVIIGAALLPEVGVGLGAVAVGVGTAAVAGALGQAAYNYINPSANNPNPLLTGAIAGFSSVVTGGLPIASFLQWVPDLFVNQAVTHGYNALTGGARNGSPCPFANQNNPFASIFQLELQYSPDFPTRDLHDTSTNDL